MPAITRLHAIVVIIATLFARPKGESFVDLSVFGSLAFASRLLFLSVAVITLDDLRSLLVQIVDIMNLAAVRYIRNISNNKAFEKFGS